MATDNNGEVIMKRIKNFVVNLIMMNFVCSKIYDFQKGKISF